MKIFIPLFVYGFTSLSFTQFGQAGPSSVAVKVARESLVQYTKKQVEDAAKRLAEAQVADGANKAAIKFAEEELRIAKTKVKVVENVFHELETPVKTAGDFQISYFNNTLKALRRTEGPQGITKSFLDDLFSTLRAGVNNGHMRNDDFQKLIDELVSISGKQDREVFFNTIGKEFKGSYENLSIMAKQQDAARYIKQSQEIAPDLRYFNRSKGLEGYTMLHADLLAVKAGAKGHFGPDYEIILSAAAHEAKKGRLTQAEYDALLNEMAKVARKSPSEFREAWLAKGKDLGERHAQVLKNVREQKSKEIQKTIERLQQEKAAREAMGLPSLESSSGPNSPGAN